MLTSPLVTDHFLPSCASHLFDCLPHPDWFHLPHITLPSLLHLVSLSANLSLYHVPSDPTLSSCVVLVYLDLCLVSFLHAPSQICSLIWTAFPGLDPCLPHFQWTFCTLPFCNKIIELHWLHLCSLHLGLIPWRPGPILHKCCSQLYTCQHSHFSCVSPIFQGHLPAPFHFVLAPRKVP